MRSIVIFIILILGIPAISANIDVSEIMFNPEDSNEWIELYVSGNNTHNISELTLTDNLHTDTIVCCDFNVNCSFILPKNQFVIIFDQDTTFNTTNLDYFYCVDDNAIGNGLGNSKDQSIISENNIVISNISYTISVDKGYSISLINGTWTETTPTPGLENIIYVENETPKNYSVDLEVLENLPNTLFTDNEYSLFKIKSLDYPDVNEKINVTFHFNVSIYLNKSLSKLTEGIAQASLNSYTTKNTGNFLFNNTGEYLLCGKILNASLFDYNPNNNVICLIYNVSSWKNVPCNITVSINLEKQIYDIGEKVGFHNIITNKTFPFKIEYWVEDLFGETVKNKVVTKNTNKKSYTPKYDGKAFIIKNNLTWIGCNNTNNKTESEELFVVKGTQDKTSKLEIEKIYLSSTNKVSFGDTLRIKVKVHKGDTSKNSLKAYVEKPGKRISYTTYFNVYEKFQDYELTIPIQIKSNCNNNYGDSTYNIYVEGLDKKINENIIITGHRNGLCGSSKTPTINAPIIQTSNKLYELVNHTFNNPEKRLVAKIKVNNPTNENHNYTVWSYVYRGSKSFSGDREFNKINIHLNKTISEKIILENDLSNITGGNYKLKIKILRDDRKTPYEITEDIVIYQIESYKVTEIVKKEISSMTNVTPKNSTVNLSNKITSNVVYTSSSEKIKNYALFLVIFMITLAGVAWFKTR